MESWFHSVFVKHRRHGEWFNFHEDMLTLQPPDEKPMRAAKTLEETTRVIPVRLPKSMLADLQRQADADDRPLSSLLYLAIADWLGTHVPPETIVIRDAARRGDSELPRFRDLYPMKVRITPPLDARGMFGE